MIKSLKISLFTLLGMLFAGPALAYDADLYAGQDLLVGHVNVSVVDGDVIATYVIDPPKDEEWCIQHVHTDLQINPADFPQTKKGNPKNGHFAVNEAVDCESSWSVNLGSEPDEPYYVAAHAKIDNTPSCQLSGVLFGTERGTGWIWAVDPVNCEAAPLIDTGDPVPADDNENSPNGLAYDALNDTLYFSATKAGDQYNSDIWFADLGGSTVGEVNGGGNNPVTGLSAGATFWMGKYWYVPNASDDLRTVDPASGLDSFVCDLDGPDASGEFRFGDSAVAPGTSILYASTNGPESTFFSIDLNGCAGFDKLCSDPGNANSGVGECADQQQMSYGSNGLLYGHSTGGGEFYVIDTTSGLNSSLACELFNDDQDELHFTDLASGPQCTADREETAWAAGNDFPGKNWATYIGPIDPFVECTFTDTAAPNYAWTWTLFLKWDGTILDGSFVTGLPPSWTPGTIDVAGMFDPEGSVAMTAFNPNAPTVCSVSSEIDVSATCTGGSCTGTYQGFEGDGDSCYPPRNWAVDDIGVCELGNPAN